VSNSTPCTLAARSSEKPLDRLIFVVEDNYHHHLIDQHAETDPEAIPPRRTYRRSGYFKPGELARLCLDELRKADGDGAFTMASIAPGTYTYHAWRPGSATITGTWDPEKPLDVRWP